MPVFMPKAPAGGKRWAASPARKTRPSCNVTTTKICRLCVHKACILGTAKVLGNRCTYQSLTHTGTPGSCDLRMPLSAWTAWYNTWLLVELTPKGIVFSFLFCLCLLIQGKHWRACDGQRQSCRQAKLQGIMEICYRSMLGAADL